MIWDDKNDDGRRQAGEDGVDGLRVFLDDNGNGQLDPGEPFAYKTLPDGNYILPIPTRYQVAGGALPPLVIEEPTGRGLHRRDRLRARRPAHALRPGDAADHGVARPVVIFLHGYGGSQIVCAEKELWFTLPLGPDLMNMRLGADGQNLRAAGRRHGVLGERVRRRSGDGGRRQRHLRRRLQALRGDHLAGAPLRLRVGLAQGAEDGGRRARRADREGARATFGVSRSVLVAHSMGGLVMRHYIENPAQAAKVARVVTVGTPYWGSPKTIFPLARA